MDDWHGTIVKMSAITNHLSSGGSGLPADHKLPTKNTRSHPALFCSDYFANIETLGFFFKLASRVQW